MSRESLEKRFVDDIRKSDVWLIGIIIYNMVTYHYPFSDFNFNDINSIVDRIRLIRNTYDSMYNRMPNILDTNHSTNELIRVMKNMLNPNPINRQTLESILSERIFQRSGQILSKEKRVLSEKKTSLYLFGIS